MSKYKRCPSCKELGMCIGSFKRMRHDRRGSVYVVYIYKCNGCGKKFQHD